MDGEVVGYHSFVRMGERLACLSGGFDRSRHSTFHAYEAILLESMRWAEDQGVKTISFGPTTNRSKGALMDRFVRTEARMFGRFDFMAPVIRLIVAKSVIAAGRLDEITGWGAAANPRLEGSCATRALLQEVAG